MSKVFSDLPRITFLQYLLRLKDDKEIRMQTIRKKKSRELLLLSLLLPLLLLLLLLLYQRGISKNNWNANWNYYWCCCCCCCCCHGCCVRSWLLNCQIFDIFFSLISEPRFPSELIRKYWRTHCSQIFSVFFKKCAFSELSSQEFSCQEIVIGYFLHKKS